MWVLETKVFLWCQMVQDPCCIPASNFLGYGYNNCCDVLVKSLLVPLSSLQTCGHETALQTESKGIMMK